MSGKGKIDEIVKKVEEKVDKQIRQKIKRKRDLKPQTLKDDKKLTTVIVRAYREAIRLMYMRNTKQNDGVVALTDLEKKIKSVNIGTKELGIFKKIIQNYGFRAFIEALETVAINSSHPSEIKAELVAAEAKNKYYTFEILTKFKNFYDPKEKLYIIPLYRIKAPFESKVSYGVPVYRLSSGITISLASNLMLDISGDGVEIIETYSQNLPIINVARNSGYEIVPFVPSPFSVSLFGGLWGKLNDSDNTIILGVKLRERSDCDSLVLPNKLERKEGLKFDVREKIVNSEIPIPPSYVYIAPEIRKFLSPNRVILLGVSNDFPVEAIASYIFKRTTTEVIITNDFNPRREYINLFVFLWWGNEEYNDLIFALKDFTEALISGILVLLPNSSELAYLSCLVKQFVPSVDVVYYDLNY